MPVLANPESPTTYEAPTETGTYHLTEMVPPPQAGTIGPHMLHWTLTPGGLIRPHFHRFDQFQILVGGEARLGKAALTPVSVNYTDAFTPYGPTEVGDDGIEMFDIHIRCDWTDVYGTYFMPESRHLKERKSGRSRFFQIKTGEPSPSSAPVCDELLAPDKKDGVAAFRLRAPAGATVTGPSPKGSGGQSYLVVAGSAICGEAEIPPKRGLFVLQDEEAPLLKAGKDGLDVLVLQFPRPAA